MKNTILLEKVEQFQDKLNELVEQDFSQEQLLNDLVVKAAAERMLQVLIESMVGIAIAMVKQFEWGYLENPAAAFDILLEKKVVDKELHLILRRAWGFRNILVHEYASLDEERLAQFYQEKTGDFKQFLRAVVEFL